MPRVTFDFWEPVDASGVHFDLLPACEYSNRLPVAGRMKDRGTEYRDYLTITRIDHLQVIGVAARIRRENLPEIIDLETGEFRPHDLPEGEGLAEVVHFLFDRRLHVLITQRNRIFRVSAFTDLICEVAGVLFDVQPKLRRDAWARFQRMERIGSLEFKLRTPEHHPNFSDTIPSMGSLLDDAADRANAYSVELRLSVERSRTRSLEPGIIRSIARLLRQEDNLIKMTATGKVAGEERSEIVDFIRDRLVHSGEVEYRGRHLDRQRCEQLLRESLERHRQYLREII